MLITKENYQDVVWTEDNISFDDYLQFYKTLNLEEQVQLLKFLLEHYPDYDEEWIQYYFDIVEAWNKEGNWQKQADFSDFVREKSPTIYQKKFNYLDTTPTLYALFKEDMETVKTRFSETIAQPVKAIDDSLRSVFNILSATPTCKDYTTEIAAQVWKPLQDSPDLLGNAEYDYSLWLYCQHIEAAFAKIQQGETVDWDNFTEQVEAVNFKFVKEFAELPDYSVSFDNQKFHKNETYRNEKLNGIFLAFLYDIYTHQRLPVYWAFKGWFDMRRYLLEADDAPNRKNWFAFTPKMIDKMGGKLRGFLGENKIGMFLSLYTLPYIYDYFFKMNYINEVTYAKLQQYYDYLRRTLIHITAEELWQYKGLYTWKKPDFISQEVFEKEKALLLNSINLTRDQARNAAKEYVVSLPSLPDDVIPPVELSPWEKMLQQKSGTSKSTKQPQSPKKKVVKKWKKKKRRRR